MTFEMINELRWVKLFGITIVNRSFSTFFEIMFQKLEHENYDFKPCLAKSKIFFVYMVIVISIHQVADKSVYWKQAAQTTQFEAIWMQLIGQEV